MFVVHDNEGLVARLPRRTFEGLPKFFLQTF